MLTDRQLIAAIFLGNTISNETDLIYLGKINRTTGKMIDYALALADKFLEQSLPHAQNLNSDEIISHLQTNNQALRSVINELNPQYTESPTGD